VVALALAVGALAAAPPGRALDGGAVEAPSRARVRFDAAALDFGTVPHHDIVRCTFTFRNVGEDPLDVLEVKTTCGCTAAEPTRRRLLPGESAALEVRFDTGQKHVPKGRMRFVNGVEIRTNDPTASDGRPGATRVQFQGEVAGRYEVIPPTGVILDGGARQAGEPARASAEVLPITEDVADEGRVPGLRAGAGGVRVSDLPDWLEVTSITPVTRAGREGVALACALKKGAPRGGLAGAITLETGNPAQPTAIVPVHAIVRPPLRAVPPRLVTASELGGAVHEFSIASTEPVEVLAAVVAPADGAAPPLAAEVAAGQKVRVRAAAGAEKGRGLSGDIVVFTSCEDAPVLIVPYILRDVSGASAAVAAAQAAGVRLTPLDLYFGSVAPGGIAQTSLVVMRESGPPIALEDVRVEPAGVLEARLDVVTPGEVARVTLSFPDGARPAAGMFAGKVTFAPRPGADRISVAASGLIEPRLAIDAPALLLRGDAPQVVTLRRVDGGPVRVTSASEPTGRLEVEVIAEEPGPARVRVRRCAQKDDGAAPAAPACAVVRIRTDVAGEEDVRLTVLDRP